MSAFPGHVMFLIETQQKMKVQGKELAIAVLEYGKLDSLQYTTRRELIVVCRSNSDPKIPRSTHPSHPRT